MIKWSAYGKIIYNAEITFSYYWTPRVSRSPKHTCPLSWFAYGFDRKRKKFCLMDIWLLWSVRRRVCLFIFQYFINSNSFIFTDMEVELKVGVRDNLGLRNPQRGWLPWWCKFIHTTSIGVVCSK